MRFHSEEGEQMKRFLITATFPDLPAAHAQQAQQVEGSNVQVAVSRALAQILKRDQVKGRRIKTALLKAIYLEDVKGGENNKQVNSG
jgi:hypothetical protein